LPPFRPLVRNPHLLTIASNFVKRRLDTKRFPVQEEFIETEPGVQILVLAQAPADKPKAHLVMLHGLEGSSNAGYLRSLAQLALEHGYATRRTNSIVRWY